MGKNKSQSEDDLTAFFEAMTKATPDLKSDLEERIIADADEILNQDNTVLIRLPIKHRFGSLTKVVGYPSVVGLAACFAFGLYIGFSFPDWSEPVATVLKINLIDEIDFADPFFGSDILLEDI